MSKVEKKQEYFQKLESLLEEYPTIFIVNVDNVGSNQMVVLINFSIKSEQN